MFPSEPIDDVLMTRPQPRSRIRVSAAWAQRNVPLRLTVRTWSHCSSVILWLIASRLIPALLTSTSSRPSSATTWFTMASTSARLVTSAATDSARAPARWSSVATGRASLDVDVVDHDGRALAREPAGRRFPDPAPRPRDQRHPPLESHAASWISRLRSGDRDEPGRVEIAGRDGGHPRLGGRSRSRPMMTRRISDVPPPHKRKRASRK